MASYPRSLCVLFALSCLAALSCKTEDAAPTAPAREDTLAGAIELLGGVDKLKRGSSFSARYKSTLLGNKIKGTLSYNTGDMRLKYFNAVGDTQINEVRAEGKCWLQYDKAVIPCLEESSAHATKLALLLEASHFYPLKERKEFKVRCGKDKLAGKQCDSMTVSLDQEIGTVLVDPDNYRVVGIKMQTKLGGKTGEFVGKFSKFEKDCGNEIALLREYTFDGKPYLTEEISGLICEEVKAAVFAEPKQVEHLKTDLRHTANLSLACHVHEGSLDRLPEALAKIEALLLDKQISVQGPPQLVHRKGPPKVSSPDRWLTDVCYPVENKAWHQPKGTWKGDFKLFERLGDEYLRVFAVGDYAANTPLMAAALLKDAKKMKRTQVGSMVQTLYMHPKHYPAEQWVSEMHLPMD